MAGAPCVLATSLERFETRSVLLRVQRHPDIRGDASLPAFAGHGGSATLRYFLFSSGLGSLTLGVAILVSFLAISYTTEARAPGAGDEVATVPPIVVGKVTPIVVPHSGPSTIYLEAATVLRLQELPAPPIGSTVPDILRTAPLGITPPPPRAPLNGLIVQKGPIENVNITFYDCANQGFCEHMYNGEWVYEGAAACSWNLPLGTAFYIVGDPTERIYVCKDRGLLDDTWVDIFWYHPSDGYAWQYHVGRYGTINIVYIP